jgi:Cys-rich protein (TIGR01571 family)
MAYLCSCCLACYGNAFNRMKLREQYDIKGNYFIDCLLYTCMLGLCAVVQEHREAKARGPK